MRRRLLDEIDQHEENAYQEGRSWGASVAPEPTAREMQSSNFRCFLSEPGIDAHRFLLPATFRRAFMAGLNEYRIEHDWV